MKQEDKELLLKDLCARLPYGVKVQIYNIFRDDFENETITIENLHQLVKTFGINNIKPYLFPLSSMDDEQIHEFNQILGKDCDVSDGYINIIDSCRKTFSYQELDALLQFLNKNHFDYKGLIEKGLAIDATNLNIY